MGLSIDEAIKQLETYTIPCGKYKAAYDLAVETMRKYQKIEQIISEWTTNMNVNTTMAMCEIEEVVKDGNVD